MLVVDEFEVWKRELLLQQFGEFFLNGCRPLPYQHDEFVDIPGDTPAGACV
jgi:hypothetical protein